MSFGRAVIAVGSTVPFGVSPQVHRPGVLLFVFSSFRHSLTSSVKPDSCVAFEILWETIRGYISDARLFHPVGLTQSVRRERSNQSSASIETRAPCCAYITSPPSYEAHQVLSSQNGGRSSCWIGKAWINMMRYQVRGRRSVINDADRHA